jgi:putative cardiolipin synthase
MLTPSLPKTRFTVLTRLAAWVAALSGASAAASAAWHAMLLAVAVSLGGCAALPGSVSRPVSHARTDVADTTLGRVAATSTPVQAAGPSGFRLLPDGAQAFEARIALIRRAEKTLDVQYYVIASDDTGRQFLGELQRAAGRGVRVRILVDDLYATGQDALFAGLAASRNVEVRLFNPLPVRNGGFVERIVLSLHEFSRINHRMHNKLFIADGSFAITGGRNIADEYFDRSGEANFIDMDVLSSGAVVAQLAAVFDGFWNSDVVYPIGSLAGAGAAASPVALPAADDAAAAADSIAAELDAGRVGLEHAEADVFADAPQKVRGDSDAPTVADANVALLDAAQSTALIASPYFVPGHAVQKSLAGLRRRDVEVSVLTNSLATTDEPLVHFGYARHRTTLLKTGVELHELMPSTGHAAEATTSFGRSGRGNSLGRLHTKLAVVDGEKTFVGSMNMDARSAHLNTEAGMIIRSEAIARQVASFLRAHQRDGSYAVRIDGERLSWTTGLGDARRALPAEPQPGSQPALPVRVFAQWLGDGML